MAATSSIDNVFQSLTLTEVELLNSELGRGAFGKVFTAKHAGLACAAKEIHPILVETSNPEETKAIKDNFLRECYYCSTLCHPNIVKFIGIYYPKSSPLPVMIMELMGESLTKYVKKSDISMKMKGFILYDVCFGLSYLHNHNPPIIHRDLSPNNILMSREENPIAKLSDLGVAKIVKADSKATKSILTKAPGTVHFMPPECLVDNPKYDTSLDIFSYAGIVLHVVNQEWPAPANQVLQDPQTGKLTPLNEVERRQTHIDKMKGEAKVLKPLVEACLHNVPSKRPGIGNVFKMLEPLQVFHLKMASLGDVNKALPYLNLIGVAPLTQELGYGAYGRIFKVNYRGMIYAAKEIHPLLIEVSSQAVKQKIKDEFLHECYQCSTLYHPNIVKFVGIYYSKKDSLLPMMVMELMGESLTKYVEKPNISIDKKAFILYSVCFGLSYLHNHDPPIIHRDLSPNNILMSLEHDSVAKISDLGVAKIIKADSKTTRSMLTKVPGTQDFMPPECMVENPTYDTSLDIFSYAGIVLHVVNQEWPTPRAQVLQDPQTGYLTALNEIERRQTHIDKMKGEAEALKPLVVACLHNISSKRPGVVDVLKMLKPLQGIKSQPTNENASSLLLTTEQNKMVFAALGSKCTTKATAVVQIFHANPDPHRWTEFGAGIVCFVKDNNKRSYYIRVLEMTPNGCSLAWEQEMYNQFAYYKDSSHFHHFTGDKFMVGLNFSSEREADKFYNAVETRIRDHQMKRTSLSMERKQKALAKTASLPKIRTKDSKGKIEPSKLQHLVCFGWDPNTETFNSDKIDVAWKQLLDIVGVKDNELEDKKTLNFIYKFVQEHGGIEKALQQLEIEKQIVPSSRSGKDNTDYCEVPLHPPSHTAHGAQPRITSLAQQDTEHEKMLDRITGGLSKTTFQTDDDDEWQLV